MSKQKSPVIVNRDAYEIKEITNISFHGNHFSGRVYVASFLGGIESANDCRDTQDGSTQFRSETRSANPATDPNLPQPLPTPYSDLQIFEWSCNQSPQNTLNQQGNPMKFREKHEQGLSNSGPNLYAGLLSKRPSGG